MQTWSDSQNNFSNAALTLGLKTRWISKLWLCGKTISRHRWDCNARPSWELLRKRRQSYIFGNYTDFIHIPLLLAVTLLQGNYVNCCFKTHRRRGRFKRTCCSRLSVFIKFNHQVRHLFPLMTHGQHFSLLSIRWLAAKCQSLRVKWLFLSAM